MSDKELLYKLLDGQNELNREVGEIKTTLKMLMRTKTIGYTKMGLLIGAGALVGELVHLVVGLI